MIHLTDFINEAADSAYKKLFGREISYGGAMKSMFSKLGMDFRHSQDRFIVYADGCMEYTNPSLFTGSICAKVYSHNLNRTISVNDSKFKVYSNDSFSHMNPPVFDMCDTPRHYLAAVYNALTHRTYVDDGYTIVLNGIDYTKGDYEKDKK